MTTVILREIWFDRVWRANACRAVEDGPELVVLHSPPGAPARFPVDEDGQEVRIPRREGWTFAGRIGTVHALRLYRPGARYSVWLFWTPDGEFDYWYINFEQPLGRTDMGFDYRDEKLDLLAWPDGTIRWKDEDELSRAALFGLVDERAVRAEARRIMRDPPWPTGWEEWKPDPEWTIPTLPAGWRRVPEPEPDPVPDDAPVEAP